MLDDQDTLRHIQSAQPDGGIDRALDETPMFPSDQRGSTERSRQQADGRPTDLEQIKRNLQALQVQQQRDNAFARSTGYTGPQDNGHVLLPKTRLPEGNIRSKIESSMLEPKFVLVDLKTGRRIELVHRQTVVGRNPNLMINVQDISVSSKHAMIDINPEFTKAYVVDLQAQNGTFLNDQRLEAAARKRLHHNDLLSFGACQQKFKFISTRQEKAEKDASDSDGEQWIDRRREYMFKEAADQPPGLQRAAQNIQPTLRLSNDLDSSQIPQYRPPPARNGHLEDRLAQNEKYIEMLLGQNQIAQADAAHTQKKFHLEKELSIRQIVEDEKKILEARHKKDMEELKLQREKDVYGMAVQGNEFRNKNEKLQRVLIDKENDLLMHQQVVADLEGQLKREKDDNEAKRTKIKALESYLGELQGKYEKLMQSEQEKTQALNELLNNDLTQKIIEYKNTVSELRDALNMKEKEREIFIQHLNLSQSDPQYGTKMMEQQSAQIMDLKAANEEYAKRQGVCEKKWTDLLDENQRNSEAVAQFKNQLESQRETYTNLLAATEKRVIQANMLITQTYSDFQEDAKRQAAEFLTSQVYQLCEERRQLLGDNDQLLQKNSELQRLTCAQRIELDKFNAYVRQDGCGPTASLLGKVEELQDLLIQQRQTTDVSSIVEKDSTIRALNGEIARKTEQIEDLKTRLQKLVAAKGNPGDQYPTDSNKDIVEYLSGLLKAKETEIERLNGQIAEILKREQVLTDKLKKLEYLFDLDPAKPLQNLQKVSTNSDLVDYLKVQDQTNKAEARKAKTGPSPFEELAKQIQFHPAAEPSPFQRNQTGLYF